VQERTILGGRPASTGLAGRGCRAGDVRSAAMQGLHLIVDLHGCRPAVALDDASALRTLCLEAVQAAGLQAVGELFHRFAPPGGVTGVVLLAESHLALHTWPEFAAVTLDVYVCNVSGDNSGRAQALLAALRDTFAPAQCHERQVERAGIAAGRPGSTAPG
jgi:S-adenosylmethionine decarboxylase